MQRSRAILARFGGVLVADGVGLGKTYVALALATLERAQGGDAAAIVPAALTGEWRRACAATGTALSLHTHTDLARRAPALLPRCTLLLVDEAHAFRNPRTRRYDALARLAVGRRIALLTATPYNNSPSDLAALVHLFAPRDRFRDLGVSDLPRALRAGDGAAMLALGAISVCRTRRLVEQRFPDLRDAFPRRRLAPAVRFDLDLAYGGRLAELLDALEALLLAQGRHERGAALMHLALMRRLESSRAAFRRSLLRHRDFLAEARRAAAEGVPLTRAAFRVAMPRRDDDDAQLVLWSLLASGPGGALECERARDCQEAVERALAIVDGATRADPKADALLALLEGDLGGRKTIVFTEHRDTARDLLRRLRRRLRVVAVTGDASWAGTSTVTRAEALDAFAPAARGRKAEPLLAADVLVATDVAGEGLNLQDAQAVVNYDLPWNPVRVMQRVGRVDRLGSPHREIVVAHLVPGGGLATLSGVLRRVRAKLETAAAAPGAEPDPLATLWWLDRGAPTPEALERESWRCVAPFEARERWRTLAGSRSAPRHPLLASGFADRGEETEAGVLLALEWPDGRRVPLPYVATAGREARLDPDALGALAERALGAELLVADAPAFATLLATVLPDARRRLADLSAARRGTDEAGPGRCAALELLRRLAATCATRRADTRAMDRALALLERELPAGLDRLLARLAAGPAVNGDFARRVAELVEPAAPPAAPPIEGAPRLVLVGAIVLAGRCPYLSSCASPPSYSTSTAP